MHYKNGIEAQVGDLVIGKTHNSDGKLRIGTVLELMPKQGPCNVRLRVICRASNLMVGSEKDIQASRFIGGQFLRAIIHRIDDHAAEFEIAEDFADCVDLVSVIDAYKALNVIESYLRYDSPYFPAPGLDW